MNDLQLTERRFFSNWFLNYYYDQDGAWDDDYVSFDPFLALMMMHPNL